LKGEKGVTPEGKVSPRKKEVRGGKEARSKKRKFSRETKSAPHPREGDQNPFRKRNSQGGGNTGKRSRNFFRRSPSGGKGLTKGSGWDWLKGPPSSSTKKMGNAAEEGGGWGCEGRGFCARHNNSEGKEKKLLKAQRRRRRLQGVILRKESNLNFNDRKRRARLMGKRVCGGGPKKKIWPKGGAL